MKKFNKGFTLIELLVVIAIIGILSSIVLASLSSARNKGTDAAVKADLSNMRAQAEIYYSNVNSYGTSTTANVFTATTANGGLRDMVTALKLKAPGSIVGTSTDATAPYTKWAAHASTTSGTWCVDSTGASKEGVSTSGSCN